MQRLTAHEKGEIYHVYNRGAHKYETFKHDHDYVRFMTLLHIANSKVTIQLSKLRKCKEYKDKTMEESNFFEKETVQHDLVDILAYCLMPNHFHLILKEKSEKGIEIFMRKLCTAYSMYFNEKYGHSGVLFENCYKSIHVDTDSYFNYLFSYVHLNPLELKQSDWKTIGVKNHDEMKDFLIQYQYSSYIDYYVMPRPESIILSNHTIPEFLKNKDDLEELLRWEASQYSFIKLHRGN